MPFAGRNYKEHFKEKIYSFKFTYSVGRASKKLLLKKIMQRYQIILKQIEIPTF